MRTGFNLRARDGFATEILSVPPGLHLRRGAGRPRSAGSARPQGQQCDAESPGNSSPTGLTTASPGVALTWPHSRRRRRPTRRRSVTHHRIRLPASANRGRQTFGASAAVHMPMLGPWSVRVSRRSSSREGRVSGIPGELQAVGSSSRTVRSSRAIAVSRAPRLVVAALACAVFSSPAAATVS